MKDAYYFPHDSNAKDDPKCIMLIEELGLEGYGIFWMLLETLRDQPEYRAPINMLPGLARRYNSTPEKVKAVVLRYQLFEVDEDEFFFSESFKRRMEVIDEKRQKRSIAGKKGNEVRWGSQSDRNAIAKHRKVKESKGKESKINIPFSEFWCLYDKKKGSKPNAEKMWNNLSDSERQEIMRLLPGYVSSFSEKKYQPHPTTFLNQRRWESEDEMRPNQEMRIYA